MGRSNGQLTAHSGGPPPPPNFFFEFGTFGFLYSSPFPSCPLSNNSFRFMAYILTCCAWKSCHCRPSSWPCHQSLLFDPWLLFWYWGKSRSLSYSVHFLWVSKSISNAVRNMGQLLHFFMYMLQAERLNYYLTYSLLLSIALPGESNPSTKMGGKRFYHSAS